MELKKWEKKSYEKLCVMYDEFFQTLSLESKKCYNKDAHEIITKGIKELSKQEENKIHKYWRKYISDIDTSYHRFYSHYTGNLDERFIPDDIFAGYIDRYLNNREIEPGLSDKNYLDLYLKGIATPKTYVHFINGIFENANYEVISKHEVEAILNSQAKFVVKPSMASYGGKEVMIVDDVSPSKTKKLLENLSCKNLIFQEAISQSNATGSIHPDSVNTIRVMTLIIDNDIKVLPCIFRMGVGKSRVDNAAQGGIFCKINNNGLLAEIAYDTYGNKYYEHPDGGTFGMIRFDFMERIFYLVKCAAQRFPHFRLIGWDIAINQTNEPVIIEANLTMSSIDMIQLACGPLFGQYTSSVLDEIFLNPYKKERSIDLLQYV